MNIKNFIQSKLFTGIMYGIALTIVALLIFQAGIMVGHRKAGYSYRLGETYYRTFGDPESGIRGALPDQLASGHGAVGKIIKLDPPTIVVESPDAIEKIITTSDRTVLKRFRETITVGELKLEDQIIVLGTPNGAGAIDAHLIRVMPYDTPPPFFIKKTKEF